MKKKKHVDLYVTGDRWHVTGDTWHVTHNTWLIVWNEHSLKISALLLFRFGIDSVLKIFGIKDHLNNEWITILFIEQPRLHPVC